MSKFRVLSGKEVCAILERYGFVEVRRRGSHIVVRRENDDGGTTTVPVPDHKELKKGNSVTWAKTGATVCHNVPKSAPQESAASRAESQEPKELSEVTSQVTILPTVADWAKVPPRGIEPLFSD